MEKLKPVIELLSRYNVGENYNEMRNKNVMLPTELFNERWLIKLLIDKVKNNKISIGELIESQNEKFDTNKLNFMSEADLNPAGENQGGTKADGLIGNFHFREKTKSGISVENGELLIAIEAKMYAPLSEKVTNVKINQLQRYLSCLNSFKNIERKYMVLIYPEDAIIHSGEDCFKWGKERNELLRKQNIQTNGINLVFQTWERLFSTSEDIQKYYETCKTLNAKNNKIVKWPSNNV